MSITLFLLPFYILDELPPERCYLVYLNTNEPYHEENKQPTKENLKRIIPILIAPYNLSTFPDFTCNGTTTTLENATFSSNRRLNQTKLQVVFKVEPYKNVSKLSAYNCAENMLFQVQIFDDSSNNSFYFIVLLIVYSS